MPDDREGDRDRLWEEAWRAAVRASPSAVGLVRLPSTRFVELSPAFAALLGTTPADGIGLEFLAMVERPDEVALSVQLVTTGAVDGVEARRHLRRHDGSVLEVPISGRAVRSPNGTALGLCVVGDAAIGDGPVPPVDSVAGRREGAETRELVPRPPVARLDAQWRVHALHAAGDLVLGHRPAELLGTPLMALVHPNDVAVLLLVFARATTNVNAPGRIRLRQGDGTWRWVEVVVTRGDEGGPHFSLELAEAYTLPSTSLERVRQLEHHLRRIATEVQASGILTATLDGVRLGKASIMSGLSARQEEVAVRLMRGERVPGIARAMYVSQSTVRNHLVAIFRKAGVHSQEALLARLRGPALDPPART